MAISNHTEGVRAENDQKDIQSTLGREKWRVKLKKVENLEMSTEGSKIWQEN